MQRLINPWEYRHIGAFGVIHVAGGIIEVTAGAICLSYRAYGWTAFFLAIAALQFAAGYWYITIARSPSART
jgi:hypothetical protein